MKLCDLTQFYSPVSGGVKRYLGEKLRYLRAHSPADEHVLIIPGGADGCQRAEGQRIYTIRSPLVSRTAQYRVLLRLRAVEEILERERPDVIESGDPYQVGWQAVRTGRALGIPVIGFYHSHFPEVFLRTARRCLGRAATGVLQDFSRRYVCRLYNRCQRTVVPSPALADLLTGWGVRRVAPTDLGVDTAIFRPDEKTRDRLRRERGLGPEDRLLLYVGRLAPEKNTHTLFQAFRLLAGREPRCRLHIIGDGQQRPELRRLLAEVPAARWTPYCGEANALALEYQAADLFVHPGVQETFGLVALEAQACGTPVVGIRGSYMDRIILGGQEHWAGENSPEGLAAAIRAALRQERMGRSGAEERERRAAAIATRYSWTQVFQGLFDVYRSVIADYRALPK
jgi:alpha-1,6-mannosyltransferase